MQAWNVPGHIRTRMIHFGIIHATYREQPTLHVTIASLFAAGVESMEVFPDVGVFGAARNLDRALRELVMKAKDGDHVCVVDDDIAVCRDAMLIMGDRLKLKWSVPHAASFYTVAHSIRHLGNTDTERGWHMVSPTFEDTWGGLVVMPRKMAIEVIACTYWRRYLTTHKAGKHCDAALYGALGSLGYDVAFHLPSLATDISDGSTTLGTTNKHELAGVRFNEWAE